jgi:hypothetical protein
MAVKVGCDGKVKYRTYQEAEKKVRAMKYSRHVDQHHQSLGFYRCRLCRFYHIGNQNKLDKLKRNRYKRSSHDKRIELPV